MQGATTVLEGTTLRGDIRGGRSVRVEGRMLGMIEVEGDLVVAENGVVRGDIRARSVRVFGVVVGSIVASTEVAVADSARVLGDVAAPRVDVAADGHVQGRIELADEGVASSAHAVLGQRAPARVRTPLDRPPLALMPYVGRSTGRMRLLG